jgi:hypothetical protein
VRLAELANLGKASEVVGRYVQPAYRVHPPTAPKAERLEHRVKDNL